MRVFLDTSVVLSYLLDQTPQLEAWGEWEAAFASELMGVEARRAIDRLRLDSVLTDEDVADLHRDLRAVEASLSMISLSTVVLRRASAAMPTQVKTLDAIHLCTALLYEELYDAQLTFATHDNTQRIGARALGFDVVG